MTPDVVGKNLIKAFSRHSQSCVISIILEVSIVQSRRVASGGGGGGYDGCSRAKVRSMDEPIIY